MHESNETSIGKQTLSAARFGAVFLALLSMSGIAENLPSNGKFRGIYDVNRAGVGSLGFFLLPEKLKEQLAPYNNTYIEMEVLKVSQLFWLDDKVMVDEIGMIAKLPAPPLELKLSAAVSIPGSPGGCDLRCTVINRAPNEITFDANTLQIGVMGYAQHPAGAAVDFQNSGYTAGQLGFTGQMAQVFNFLSPMGPGARTHFFTGSVTLRPCEEAPFIVHDVQRQPGEYELVASATFYTAEREHIPLRSSLALDLPLEAVKTKPIQSLTLKANAANDDEWLIVKGNIADEFGADVSLFTKSREQDHFLPGLVEIYSDSGELLPADLDWQEPDGSWRSISLGREGVSFKFRVRPRDRFSRAAVTKIEFTTVTNRGRERFILADHLVASTRPELPAWGDTVGGCRMRIAVPRDCFKGSERVRFFVQAESDGSGADLLWVNSGKFQSQVKAMIDGKQAQIESGGVGDAIVNSFPFQGDVALALIERLAPGKHLLQFAVKGDPGIYENTRGESFRKFDGTLVSNTVEFELRPEK